METETQFPLPPGSEVSLKCSTGYTLTGDTTVTCKEGTTLLFNNTPVCQLGLTFDLSINFAFALFCFAPFHFFILHHFFLSFLRCVFSPFFLYSSTIESIWY